MASATYQANARSWQSVHPIPSARRPYGRKKKKACGSEVHDEEDYNWNLKDTSMWGLNNESEEDLDGEVEHEEDELTSRMRKRKS